MSDYATAVLAKGQAVVAAKYNTAEQRRQVPTVMGLALKNQSYSIPDANELRKSPLRPVEINYFTNVAPGTGTAKAYNHTGTYGDTGKVTLVYISVVETIGLPRKIADNNIITYQAMFNNLYEMKWKNLRTRQDNAALAFLYANRTQIPAATMNPSIAAANAATYNAANFALEIGQQQKNLFIQGVKSTMSSRFYAGELDLVTDLQLAANFEFQMNQGAGNYQDLGFQFNGCSINKTQVPVDTTYPQGALFALPQGMFAGLNWNEALNRRGVDGGDTSSIGILSTAADPFGSGAIADLSMYTQRGDTSGVTTSGSTQDIIDQWELTLTMAYALPPLSLTGDSVVHEFALTT